MLNAQIQIPILHCTQQYDENGNSEPYLWFAYFWGDATSIAAQDSQPPITVFVPSVPDTRAQYPDNIGNNSDIPVPAAVGRFAVNLEGGGSNLTMLGVLAVLFEEDDTHSDAIAAGYDAFRTAVSRELNNYVKTKGLTPPDNAAIQNIVSGIYTSVYNAIADKEGLWHGFWDNQDDYIGYSYALFLGLPEPATPTVQDLGLAPIDADAFKIVINSISPLSWSLVKVGHNHYEFIRAQLSLTTVPGVCADKAKAFAAAVETLRKLRDQRNKLKARLAQTPEKEHPSIRKEIANLQSSEIPAAESALRVAAGALRDCHILTSIAGNKP
jgi:hypothetical protein